MTTLTVGSGQKYTTIAAAVAASASGDVINVMAGTYTNDFLTIRTNLTIQAVGGAVNIVATSSPPNGKAIITEGASGITVTLSGLTLSGAKVADGNGAGVRYEGGTLVMNGMTVTGNQEGILGGSYADGVITINNSTFTANGTGTGYTHNIYVGAIDRFTLTNSVISNAVVGHDIKSRAANTTITGNLITDTAGTASYEIDLPNGGNAVISGNTIQKGTNAQNPIAISYGEEGNLYANGSLSVTNNVMVNAYTAHSTTAIRNTTSVAAVVSGNTFYGWNNLTDGTATLSANTKATTQPALTLPSSSMTGSTTGSSTGGTTTPVSTDQQTIVLKVSEDAWRGDAQFTVSVDGKQQGGTYTATASHAAGKSQDITLTGAFGTGQHAVAVSFVNDAYAGPGMDRNLYVDSIVSGSAITQGAAMMSNNTMTFLVGNKSAGTATPAPVTVGSGSRGIALQISEDAWLGDAQFTVKVDGTQIGGVLTASALHGKGEMQQFDIRGAFTAGLHKVEVGFLNDAYGGAGMDRNLYVDKVAGATMNASLLSNGPQTFYTVIPNT